jgi:hypothetical protein
VVSIWTDTYKAARKRSKADWIICRSFYLKAGRDVEVAKLAIEFCVELAVLLAVFPLVDTQLQNGSPSISHRWFVIGALSLAAVSAVGAVIMRVRLTERREKEGAKQ